MSPASGMTATGVDVSAQSARTVTVDANGTVVDSASYSGADAASALTAATSASRQSERTPLGIATDDPELAHSPTAKPNQSAVTCRPGDALVTAEAWIGSAKNAAHAVCLWLGDRVLAGVLLNGAPWRGAHGLAGSAAWLALNPVERQDYRRFGGFAAEVNDRGIARRLAWRVQAGDESEVVERAGGLEAITASHVFDGARAGDGVAISVVRDTARYIAMAAANLAICVDPEIVIIGGPVTGAKDLLQDALRQDFDRRLPPPMAALMRCEFSSLGQDAIAIGAARMAMLALT